PSLRKEAVRVSIRPARISLRTSDPRIRTRRPPRLATKISRVSAEKASGRLRRLRPGSGAPPACGLLLVTISDAIERFDRVELRVHFAELLAHALDVAVDRAVVDIDLIVIGRVHQRIAALHIAGALG